MNDKEKKKMYLTVADLSTMGFAMVIGAYFGSRMAIRHGASYVKPLYLIVTTLLIGKQVYELLFK